MTDDWADVLACLLEAEVRFMVVGAHALAVHGIPRATVDLDVWIRPTEENAQRVWTALVEFGAPLNDLGIRLEDFSSEGTVVQLGLPPNCQNRRDDYEQYVIQEYLANRLLNIVMDLSLRVRLARVTYVDTEGSEDTLTKFAFLSEHKNELEDRTNTEEMELPGLSVSDVDPHTMGLVNMFEYVIGNADWSVPALHNIIVFKAENFDYHTVPYDFDCTGIVNPRYASRCAGMICTDEMLRQDTPCRRRVTERLYRGYCGTGNDDEQLVQLQPFINIFGQ